MTLEASKCETGHVFKPDHPVCPKCGGAIVDHVDLTERKAEIITWTTSTATPPGVREPNHLAIVEFAVEGTTVRTIGQVTTGDIGTGDQVEPVAVDQLRDPEPGIRHHDSQDWDGYRFQPVE